MVAEQGGRYASRGHGPAKVGIWRRSPGSLCELASEELDRRSDWYERVFGFDAWQRGVLIEEEEDCVSMVMLEHPEGMPLCVHQSPDLASA